MFFHWLTFHHTQSPSLLSHRRFPSLDINSLASGWVVDDWCPTVPGHVSRTLSCILQINFSATAEKNNGKHFREGKKTCLLTYKKWIKMDIIFSSEVCVHISEGRDHTHSVIVEIIAYTTCIQQTKKRKEILNAKQVICWEIRPKEDDTRHPCDLG